MARLPYAAIQDRFTHIDGRFEGLEVIQGGGAILRVKVYPWWEHPAYLEARAAGRPWGFSYDIDDAGVTLTVFARNVREMALSGTNEIEDWAFSRITRFFNFTNRGSSSSATKR